MAITRAQYMQLVGLATMARKHYKLTEACIVEMQELVGESQRDEICAVVYADMPVETVLEHMHAEMEPQSKAVIQ